MVLKYCWRTLCYALLNTVIARMKSEVDGEKEDSGNQVAC